MEQKDVTLDEDSNEQLTLNEYLNDLQIVFMDEDGYYLEKENLGREGFLYTVYSPEPGSELIDIKQSLVDVSKLKHFERSAIYDFFMRSVDSFKHEHSPFSFKKYPKVAQFEGDDDTDAKEAEDARNLYARRFLDPRLYPEDWKEFISSRYNTGFLDKLNKSDTLVLHKTDPSTTMLSQIYEGKGWDVLTEGNVDPAELRLLFESHDKLVFLGHGTSYGLMGMFGGSVAGAMKGKKIFAIWCNADGYFQHFGNGEFNGQFITGNMPSERGESIWAGCGNISPELMLENITYWSKLCADVVDKCLDGRVEESVDYIRKNYLEKYGNHPVSIYNANRTQALGIKKPLPAYEFKGKPLEPKDYPIPDFDEKEFLEHPVENIKDLPNGKDVIISPFSSVPGDPGKR